MCEYILLENFNIEKYILDKNNRLWNELQGDYCFHCLTLPTEKEIIIGIWGQRHRRLLKENHRVRYMNLLTSCKLNAYFAERHEQAEEMFSQPVKQMPKKQGIKEQMKAENQMLWVGRMNNIH